MLKANVRLADIDVNTRCIQADEIRRLITSRTKVSTGLDLILSVGRNQDNLVSSVA